MDDARKPFTATEWDQMCEATRQRHIATAEEELLAELARDARQNFHAEADARRDDRKMQQPKPR